LEVAAFWPKANGDAKPNPHKSCYLKLMPEEDDQLTPRDVAIIGDALRLAADGPLFPDWEFQTLFGIERDDVRDVATRWPNVDVKDDIVQLAVLGSLNLFVGYPHGYDELLEKTLGVDTQFIRELFGRAATTMGRHRPPDDFVSRLVGNF